MHSRQKRNWRLVAVVSCGIFLAVNQLVGGLLGTRGGVNPVLNGGHPYHFPVYFEDVPGLASELTEFELQVMLPWRAKHEGGGVFRYRLGSKVEPLETRPLFVKGMILQAAVGRAGKRKLNRTTNSVLEPFNPNSFNFAKAKSKEVLATFSDGALTPVDPKLDPDKPTSSVYNPHANLILVNANPFAAFHFLLAPSFGSLLQQKFTPESLALALKYARQCSRHLKLIFNSIGAGASINHHHWQGFYLRIPLPIEKQPTQILSQTPDYTLFEVTDWPIRAYIIEAEVDKLVVLVSKIISKLLDLNIAHNLLICSGGRRVVVVPRKIGNFPDVSKKQVAAMEVLGFWVIPNKQEYMDLDKIEALDFLSQSRPQEEVDVAGILKSG
eukprot:TRINITY_DN24146_c0_g1_i1.p1 TRINITY_DN24146_c0_g1~~TRINITY_DN24146_c0_g1_i1.p1  ORF type:complete len:383 (+),score=86.93 TRINITY_DN24146_c0_g1_i1:82-1230(+)